MGLSIKTVNGYKPLTILTKVHIQDHRQGPEPISTSLEQIIQNRI